MLPPIDEALLRDNPGFANVYRSLTTNALHSDGSTKNDPTAKQRDVIRSELKEFRFSQTKRHILMTALKSCPPPGSQSSSQEHRRAKSQLARAASHEVSSLPPELSDLLLLLPPFLDRAASTRPTELKHLLSSPPFSDLLSLLPMLTPIISSHLVHQASGLARVLHPSTNPSFIHRSIPQLVPSTQSLLSTLSQKQEVLTSSRLSTYSHLVEHLNRHTEALVLLLQVLEAKHGLAAQSTALRATEASLEAQLWAVSLNILLWETRVTIYPPESQQALRNYRNHLRDSQMQLENKMRTREQELGEYGVSVTNDHRGNTSIGKTDELRERTFREMARIWMEMEGRLKEIRGDMARLDHS